MNPDQVRAFFYMRAACWMGAGIMLITEQPNWWVFLAIAGGLTVIRWITMLVEARKDK